MIIKNISKKIITRLGFSFLGISLGFLGKQYIDKLYPHKKINNYNINRYISDDNFNNSEDGQYRDDIYIDNKKVGYIEYRIKTGQICLFYIYEREIRNCGLGKNVLYNTIETIRFKNPQIKYVWAATSKNHPFWSNVYNKNFIYSGDNSSVHNSITGFGYSLELSKFDEYLLNNNNLYLAENIFVEQK
jgi:hypothetical protein